MIGVTSSRLLDLRQKELRVFGKEFANVGPFIRCRAKLICRYHGSRPWHLNHYFVDRQLAVQHLAGPGCAITADHPRLDRGPITERYDVRDDPTVGKIHT